MQCVQWAAPCIPVQQEAPLGSPSTENSQFEHLTHEGTVNSLSLEKYYAYTPFDHTYHDISDFPISVLLSPSDIPTDCTLNGAGTVPLALPPHPPSLPLCHSFQLIYSRLLAMPLPLQSAVASHECTYSPGASLSTQGVVDHHIPTPVKELANAAQKPPRYTVC